MRLRVGRLQVNLADELHLVRLRRRHEVIQERAAAGEPLDPEQLLGIQAAIGRPMLGVALTRDAAVLDVVHGRLASAGVRTPV